MWCPVSLVQVVPAPYWLTPMAPLLPWLAPLTTTPLSARATTIMISRGLHSVSFPHVAPRTPHCLLEGPSLQCLLGLATPSLLSDQHLGLIQSSTTTVAANMTTPRLLFPLVGSLGQVEGGSLTVSPPLSIGGFYIMVVCSHDGRRNQSMGRQGQDGSDITTTTISTNAWPPPRHLLTTGPDQVIYRT